MASSEESRLDSALRRGLKGMEGVAESARLADENITSYLKKKFGEVLLREYRRRSNRIEDESAIEARTSRVLDDVVLDAQKLYRLFELHMNHRLDEAWEGLNLGDKAEEPLAISSFADSYATGAERPSIGLRKFYCVEGCVFEGESAYLDHRDRGHHPVPA